MFCFAPFNAKACEGLKELELCYPCLLKRLVEASLNGPKITSHHANKINAKKSITP